MPTLGELEAAGWQGLETRCRRCRRLTVLIWAYLKLPPETPAADVLRRLRCSHCGLRPEPGDARPYRLVNAYSTRPQPDPGSAPALDPPDEAG